MIISNKTYIAEVNTKSIRRGIATGLIAGSALFGGIVGGGKLAGIGRFAPQSSDNGVDSSPSTTTNQAATINTPMYHHDTIKKMIISDEGIRNKMYYDTKGIKTVGIGHNLENVKKSVESFNTAFGKDGSGIRNHVLAGGSLTTDQANKLFDSDYHEHLGRAIKLIPNLHDHPADVQAVLVSGTYRGHIGDSPKFRRMFTSGDYHGAANEFLNRREYKNPNPKAPGVITRLERDHKILSNYATSMEPNK